MCTVLYLPCSTAHGQQYECDESYVLILKCHGIKYECLLDTLVKVGALLCSLLSLLQKT